MRQRKYGRLAIDPKLHHEIAVAAAREGVSMKTLAESLLRAGMAEPLIAHIARRSTLPVTTEGWALLIQEVMDAFYPEHDRALSPETEDAD